MTRTLLGLAVMVAAMGATVARADDYDGRYRQAVPVDQHDCGPRPQYAPQGQEMAQGRYELQTVQTWVEGQQQQVWVPGQCRQHRRWQRCSEGHYRTVQTAGRYETRQEWVWVAAVYEPRRGPSFGQHDRRHGVGRGGIHLARPAGSFSVSVY